MPALRELQRAFAAGLISGDVGAIGATIVPVGIGPDTRLGIYRNTMESALTGALKLTYPVIEQLVGADFFRQAALAFVRSAPPRRALLSDYGDGFAAFLVAYPPARTLPYLADIARLEWTVEQAARAPLTDEAPPRVTVALPGFILAFAPSLTLLRTDFPAEAIWRAVIDGDEAGLEQIDITPAATRVAVWRWEDGAAVARLSIVAGAFLDGVLSGLDADTALTAAAAADPTADPIAAITTGIFQAGFARLTPNI